MPLAVEINQLCKVYRTVSALSGCDLAIRPGAVVGLLGPNGAGKSTLLRTMLGFIRPTSGSAKVFGLDCHKQSLEVRRNIAYLPGDARLYGFMRGKEAITMFCGFQPNGSFVRSMKVAQRLELDVSRRVMFMSTGMRQKLALSIVLGSQSPLIIMDEPTANLDPTVRYEFQLLLNELKTPEQTILISSHIFSDIEDTCDQVILLKQGRVAATAELSQLRKMHVVRGRPLATSRLDSPSSFLKPEWPSFVESVQWNDGLVELHLSGAPEEWLAWLSQARLNDISIQHAGVSSLYQRIHSTAAKESQDHLA